MTAPTPPREVERLSALRSLGILDTPPEPEYDDLTRLTAAVCGVPIAIVSFIDSCRQWFKSRIGLDATETHRDSAFCAYAILQPDLFVVPDAISDARFQNNPLVTDEPRIRFYAGMPLATPEGHNLGTLCVIDRVPRTLTNTQSDALRVLARHVVTQLMLRRQLEWSKVIEAELRASEAKFRNTVDRLAEGVFVVDPLARKIIDANLAVLAILGYTKSEFVGRSPEDIMAQEIPEVTTRNFSRIDSELATTGRRNLGRKCLRGKDGSLISVDVRITLIPNDGVGLQAFVIRDLTEQCAYEDRLFLYQTELENANAKLKQLANTDGLTGVRNRSAFNAKLLEEYDRANRYNHPLSVILMDVDHFKIFNDTFGHPAGDEVLKAVGRTLQETARSTDFVARYGGEEFAVLLPDTELSGAMVLAERFRRAIASVSWDKRAVTVSVGVSTSTKQTPEASKLVQEADEALYRSKKKWTQSSESQQLIEPFHQEHDSLKVI